MDSVFSTESGGNGKPRRTIFTSVRRAGSRRLAILACREVLDRTVRDRGP